MVCAEDCERSGSGHAARSSTHDLASADEVPAFANQVGRIIGLQPAAFGVASVIAEAADLTQIWVIAEGDLQCGDQLISVAVKLTQQLICGDISLLQFMAQFLSVRAKSADSPAKATVFMIVYPQLSGRGLAAGCGSAVESDCKHGFDVLDCKQKLIYAEQFVSYTRLDTWHSFPLLLVGPTRVLSNAAALYHLQHLLG